MLSRAGKPYITTLHDRLDLPELQPVFNTFSDVPVVSVSDSQRRPLPQANFVRTVLHGLPKDLLTPQGGERGYLAFLGRICPEKGCDRAIRIARAAGIPLKIAAKVDRTDQDYFNTVVKPILAGGGVEMIGEITDAQKPAFLSGAVGLLMPIDWPEPFGLVMIEAMACGTPVLAFNRGSVPEVLEDSLTGIIVEDETSAVASVRRLPGMNNDAIRWRFEQRFTARRMAEAYLAVYREQMDVGRASLRLIADSAEKRT